tara:strand:+ start:227 stop:1045 length:819 start_codon:yes stop_codon:yes gene_type:complete
MKELLQKRPMMMNKTLYKCVILVILIVTGCSVNKKTSNNTFDLTLDLKNAVKEIKKSEKKFKNLRNRARIEFDNGKTIQSVIVNLRVLENEALWISASMIVPIAKALITKDRLIFYEKFQRTYIDSSLKNNKQRLPPVSMELIQNILFGKPAVDIDNRNWKIIQNPMHYVLTPSDNEEIIQPTLFFNPTNFALEEQRIYFSSINTLVAIEYNNFKSLNEQNIPTEVFMSIIRNGEILKIKIEYSQIDFPDNLTFPIAIPEGYRKININELLQ